MMMHLVWFIIKFIDCFYLLFICHALWRSLQAIEMVCVGLKNLFLLFFLFSFYYCQYQTVCIWSHQHHHHLTVLSIIVFHSGERDRVININCSSLHGCRQDVLHKFAFLYAHFVAFSFACDLIFSFLLFSAFHFHK